MKLVQYKLIQNKYYRNETLITKAQAKEELRGQKFRELNRTGKCNVRQSSIPITIEPKEKKVRTKINKDLKLLEQVRPDYKIELAKYKTGPRLELWRKNHKFGYFNFVAYLENDTKEYIDKIILKDAKNQKLEQKKKKGLIIIEDDI